MKKIICLIFLCLGYGAIHAQEDLLGDLMKEDAAKVKQNITGATFKSTRVINMQSVEITGKGNLQFMISHHFGYLWNDKKNFRGNAAQFFGLNSGFANTYLSLDYSPLSYLNLGGAMYGDSRYEGWAKAKLLRQQTGKSNIPVTVDWFSLASVDAKSGGKPDGYDNFTWNRFSFLNQLLIARKFNENLSMQFTPSHIHYNYIPYGVNNVNDIFSLGLAGRYKLTRKTAVTFEYSRQLNGYKNLMTESGSVVSNKPDLISLGYDWDTGGHIFQFYVSSTGNASNIAQLASNSGNFAKGNFALGFTINRSFGVKKVVKTAE